MQDTHFFPPKGEYNCPLYWFPLVWTCFLLFRGITGMNLLPKHFDFIVGSHMGCFGCLCCHLFALNSSRLFYDHTARCMKPKRPLHLIFSYWYNLVISDVGIMLYTSCTILNFKHLNCVESGHLSTPPNWENMCSLYWFYPVWMRFHLFHGRTGMN